MRKLIFACIIFTLPFSAIGYDKELVITNHQSSTFENTDCAKTDSCSLKRIEYIVEEYKVGIGDDYTYGTRFFARYETDAVNHLEDYVFVQFVRGCVYWDDYRNGEKVRDYVYYGPPTHNGQQPLFNLDHWVIDTDNPDPVFSSYAPGLSRHAFAMWNLVPGSVDETTARFYAKECPRFPELYIADHPHGVYVKKNGNAKNASLQFRTCIYKTADVPTSLFTDGSGLGETLHCYDWNVSFIYDYEKGLYKHPDTLVCPTCDK